MVPLAPKGLREREILTAIIDTYIATGEPVGSRTLSRTNKNGLSPATIRNVMSDLADSGFLDQPHTSAGRIPTAEAYRYYVAQITGTARLSPADEEMISSSFQGVGDVDEFLERTSHVLSLVSSGVGVAVAIGGSKTTLDHVYFSRLSVQKVLAVVVTGAGVVRDRVLRLPRDFSQDELDTAARFINENFRGWAMDELKSEIARRIDQERSEFDFLMESIAQLYRGGALAADEPSQAVFVEGVANLVASERGGSDLDKARLGEMLRTLEEKQRLIELLSAYLDARQETVRVVIGLEDTVPQMRNFVLIGVPARVGGEVMGSLAVIGPTRMDYEHTITAVSYIARLFDQVLNENA